MDAGHTALCDLSISALISSFKVDKCLSQVRGFAGWFGDSNVPLHCFRAPKIGCQSSSAFRMLLDLRAIESAGFEIFARVGC